jgi:hypothetical protein
MLYGVIAGSMGSWAVAAARGDVADELLDIASASSEPLVVRAAAINDLGLLGAAGQLEGKTGAVVTQLLNMFLVVVGVFF